MYFFIEKKTPKTNKLIFINIKCLHLIIVLLLAGLIFQSFICDLIIYYE